jgi:hypothetical protein
MIHWYLSSLFTNLPRPLKATQISPLKRNGFTISHNTDHPRLLYGRDVSAPTILVPFTRRRLAALVRAAAGFTPSRGAAPCCTGEEEGRAAGVISRRWGRQEYCRIQLSRGRPAAAGRNRDEHRGAVEEKPEVVVAASAGSAGWAAATTGPAFIISMTKLAAEDLHLSSPWPSQRVLTFSVPQLLGIELN